MKIEIICNINLKELKEKIEELKEIKKKLEENYLLLRQLKINNKISDNCCFFDKEKKEIEKRTYKISIPRYSLIKKDNKLLVFDKNNKKYNLYINKKNNFLLIIDDNNKKLEDKQLINRLNYLVY